MNAKNACALFLGVAFLLLFIVLVIPHVYLMAGYTRCGAQGR